MDDKLPPSAFRFEHQLPKPAAHPNLTLKDGVVAVDSRFPDQVVDQRFPR